MTRPILYVAITAHGFGHATRAAALVDTLQRLRPDLLPILVTTAPRWLLGSYISGEFLYRPRALDVGVVQQDSLQIDRQTTLEQLQALRSRAAAIVAAEVDFIRQMSVKNGRVALVLADLPPLAIDIAQAAGLPCWAVGNFGWDFIYRDWGGEFEQEADWIADRFHRCDRLFRLPFHEPMASFPQQTDVGLTGGAPRYGAAELRDKLGLPDIPRDRTVLLTFGGLGLQQIPYERLWQFPDWLFITFDRSAPDLPNLYQVLDPIEHHASDRPFRPVDFMPLCGRIVSKPGYGTFAEACRTGPTVATLTRDGFAEAPILLDQIQTQTSHQILQPTEFFEGDWSFLQAAPTPSQPGQRFTLDGNETIAQAISAVLET
ncbi:glycosyl transferase [Limnothrix sp. FACHB-1083]|uniref:glycosyl transferase n=1 Tax=unclassified Limnothrix TaxID=2632864 RepID=UPI001680AD58|nr:MULTISPECIES: glycosyl transferase [unclassified Limnothrix]MBD2161519.1 glycosyl transferase [Limnothrix sp. FACHB-1083]MBD2192233.1 glycosyl transferase [Limnothrix sp. FACHB-1088]